MEIVTVDGDSGYLGAVKVLGKRNSLTLGFFPEGAFDAAAKQGTILAAVHDGALAGYLLYRKVETHSRASIVHLCVDSGFRKRSVGRLLVDRLKELTRELYCITLHCRRDYEASKVWPRYGFVAEGHRIGKSLAGDLLTCWRYEHRAPPILEFAHGAENDDKRPIAVLDANVFYDLCSPPTESNEESRALEAGWLRDFIRIRVTKEILNEIERREDTAQMTRQRAQARRFKPLPTEMRKVESHIALLRKLWPDSSQKTSFESDIRQLAHTIVGEAAFFVTRDELLLKRHAMLVDEFGIELLRPCDVILRLDELLNYARYRVGRLAGAALKFRMVKSGEVRELAHCFHKPHERKPEFEGRLRRYLAAVDSHETGVTHEDQLPQSLIVRKFCLDAAVLDIPVLRRSFAPAPVGVLRYLLYQSAVLAVEKGMRRIRVSEPLLCDESIDALRQSGFCCTDEGWVKPLVDQIVTRGRVASCLESVDSLPHELAELAAQISTGESATALDSVVTVSALERHCWPLKVADAPLRTWVVPIRAHWAKHLFEERIASGDLFGASKDLILRNENVYYRKKGTQNIKAPARVLWYVSEEDNELYSGQILAYSLMIEVEVGLPSALFRKYRGAGVYRWRDIVRTSGGDLQKEIMAFRFVDTELLKPIPRERFQQIVANESGKKINLAGPAPLSPRCFELLYREGRKNEAF